MSLEGTLYDWGNLRRFFLWWLLHWDQSPYPPASRSSRQVPNSRDRCPRVLVHFSACAKFIQLRVPLDWWSAHAKPAPVKSELQSPHLFSTVMPYSSTQTARGCLCWRGPSSVSFSRASITSLIIPLPLAPCVRLHCPPNSNHATSGSFSVLSPSFL